MKNTSIKWEWEDGWILMAIHMSENNNGASLCDIISAADATNHTIPTADELTKSFTKFFQHSLIRISENHYFICEQYINPITQAYCSKGGLFKTADKGLKWLKNSTLIKENEEIVLITVNDVKKAHKQYIHKKKRKV